MAKTVTRWQVPHKNNGSACDSTHDLLQAAMQQQNTTGASQRHFPGPSVDVEHQPLINRCCTFPTNYSPRHINR